MASASCFEQTDLAKYSLSITLNLLMLSPLLQNPEQVFCFGKTALTIFVRNIICFGPVESARFRSHGSSLYFTCVYYMLGSACLGLERYYECWDFLDWADDNLNDLENDHCDRKCVRYLLAATQRLRYHVKVAMGKKDEAVVHAKKALEFMELMMDEGFIELGNAYIETYEAYVDALDTEQALPLCLKALEIYTRHEGQFSRKAVLLRIDLAVLYHVGGENDKAALQNLSWQRVPAASISDYVNPEIKIATMLIHLGRCEEAIYVMKDVVSRNDTETGGRVASFCKMASAACILGKFDDAEMYTGEAKRMLEENDIDPLFSGTAYLDMSRLYEQMKDFDTAISLSKRVLENAEHRQRILQEGSEKLSHQKLFAESSARLFSLFSLAGWEKEEMLPFMIDVMTTMAEIFGGEHIEVGYGCARLGVALMKSGRTNRAVTLIEKAKYIMDVVLGPHHVSSLRTSHTLSEIYVDQRRILEAMEIQEKFVKGSEGLRPNEQQFVEKLLD